MLDVIRFPDGSDILDGKLDAVISSVISCACAVASRKLPGGLLIRGARSTEQISRLARFRRYMLFRMFSGNNYITLYKRADDRYRFSSESFKHDVRRLRESGKSRGCCPRGISMGDPNEVLLLLPLLLIGSCLVFYPVCLFSCDIHVQLSHQHSGGRLTSLEMFDFPLFCDFCNPVTVHLVCMVSPCSSSDSGG